MKLKEKVKVDLLPFYSTSSVKQNCRVKPHTKMLFFIYSYAACKDSCDSPGLVDFAIPLVSFVCTMGKWEFLGIQITEEL